MLFCFFLPLFACGDKISYVTQQDGMRVPAYPWEKARITHTDLNATQALPLDYASRGNIWHGTERYDMKVEAVDSDGDGEIDLARITLDSRLVQAEGIPVRMPRWHVRAIVQDTDLDSDVDSIWYDRVLTDGRSGVDGIYDEMREPMTVLQVPMRDILFEPWSVFQ